MVNFVHVGLHKTGTTWLQHFVFPRHPDLTVIVPPDPLYEDLLMDLRATPDGEFDLSRWHKEFIARMHRRPPDDHIFGISNENLSGGLVYSRMAEMVADRLYAAFGGIKILLVIRHPVSYISSAYNQHVRQGRRIRGGPCLSMKGFVNIRGDEGFLVLRKVDYKSLIACYESRFGVGNVCVLPFELLLKSATDFLDRVWRFLEVPSIPAQQLSTAPVGVSFTRVAVDIMRFLDNAGLEIRPARSYIRKFDRVLFRHISSPPRFTMDQICQYQPAFNELFVESNYSIWNADLAKFNYRFN